MLVFKTYCPTALRKTEFTVAKDVKLAVVDFGIQRPESSSFICTNRGSSESCAASDDWVKSLSSSSRFTIRETISNYSNYHYHSRLRRICPYRQVGQCGQSQPSARQSVPFNILAKLWVIVKLRMLHFW